MSSGDKGQDLLGLAAKAEQDLNSSRAKTGVQEGTGHGGKDNYHGASDSTRESGVDESVTSRFPGSTVDYGSSVTGREIPAEQGGGVQRGTGKVTKGDDFEEGEPGQGPEDVAREQARDQGGRQDVVDRARGVNAEKNKMGIDE